MSITSGLAFIEAIMMGKLVEDKEVNQLQRRQLWLYIHSHGEATLIIAECIASFERLIGIYQPKFHASGFFLPFFIVLFIVSQSYVFFYIFFRMSKSKVLLSIAFGSTNIIEIMNLCFLILLFYKSKSLYFETRGQLSLRRRYQLSSTYELAKCLLPSAFFSTSAVIIVFFYIWLKIVGVFGAAVNPEFYFIMNLYSVDQCTSEFTSAIVIYYQTKTKLKWISLKRSEKTDLLINTFSMLFPWTIILAHRKIKMRVFTFFGIKSARIQQYGVTNIRNLEGDIMNSKPDQNAYFDQLKDAWRIT